MGIVVDDLKRSVASRPARDYVEQVAAISSPPNYRSYLSGGFSTSKSQPAVSAPTEPYVPGETKFKVTS